VFIFIYSDMRSKKAISKYLVAIIIIVIIIAGVAGYSYYLTITTPKPVTLNVVVVSGWNDKTVEMAAKDFEAVHPNVHFNFIETTFSNVLQKEIVAESQGNASSYDIFTWSPTMSGAIAPYVTPLGPLISQYNYNISDIPTAFLSFGGEFYNLSTKQTEIIGLPLDLSVLILFYRTDIFGNATLANEFQAQYGVPFNPNEWTNWTEVVWAAQFIQQHHAAQYGIIVDDNPSHGLIDTYPAIFYWWYMKNSTLNGGTKGGLPPFNILFTPQLKPSFNNSAGVEALVTLKQLVQYEPAPNVLIVDYSHLQSLFGSGQAGMEIGWSGFYDSFNNPSNYPAVAGKISMALLPGGYAEAGGSFLGIAKYSAHKALAFQFLEFITSDKEAVSLYYRGGFPPDELGAIRLIASNSTYSKEWSFYTKAAQVAYANPPALPITSSELMPVLNHNIYNYITGVTNDPYTALNTAASQWATYINQYLSK